MCINQCWSERERKKTYGHKERKEPPTPPRHSYLWGGECRFRLSSVTAICCSLLETGCNRVTFSGLFQLILRSKFLEGKYAWVQLIFGMPASHWQLWANITVTPVSGRLRSPYCTGCGDINWTMNLWPTFAAGAGLWSAVDGCDVCFIVCGAPFRQRWEENCPKYIFF